MSLIEILKQQARVTENSGFRVEMNAAYSWVNILKIDSKESTVLLQDEEGAEFIDEVERLWKTRNLTRDTIAKALAGPYLENIEYVD